MPRIAEARRPAAAISERQVARRERILDAAAELGADAAYEQVQMLDVARRADVAIATLYRYFPSKTHLFAAVFEARIDRFVTRYWTGSTGDPVEDLGERLVALSRDLLSTPKLCATLMHAAAASYVAGPPDDDGMPDLMIVRAILDTLGDRVPDRADLAAIRLLIYSWWGVLVSGLNHKLPAELAESDLRLATRLILAPFR
ncbi:TetR/AcrR family transcriptional regulator [Nocardia sp. NPDC088792]|uniref:TetR/AcrR family transcriptional regulator n=1 Tax=Nocardia sp. NPDC088792 TaxID=3364332 RepID=UPI0037FF367D